MSLQPREKKLVTLAIVAAILFAAYYWVLPIWSNQAGGGDSLPRVQKELRRQKELIAASKQIQSQTGLLAERLADQERHLVVPGDVNKASADLQGWIVQQAAAQQLDIIRSEFLPVTPVGGAYVRIPVQFEFNGQMTQFAQFFGALQRGDKIVSVEDLQINSTGTKDKRVRCVIVIATLMPKAS